MMTCPPSLLPTARAPSRRRSVAAWDPSSREEKRTPNVMSATASPSVSILSSYSVSGENGSAGGGPGGSTTADGGTFLTPIDLPASPGFGKAYRSVKLRHAASPGNPKAGPEEWLQI